MRFSAELLGVGPGRAPESDAGLRPIHAAEPLVVDQPLAAGQGKGGIEVVVQLVVITPANPGR